MTSPEARALWDEFWQARDPSMPFDLAREREGTVNAGDILPHPDGVGYRTETVADVPVVWAIPERARSDGVVLWIHGGAFTLMSAETHRHFAGHLAAKALLPVIIADYSLAPEHPFPRALVEVSAVFYGLQRSRGHESIFVVGDSAGGALAVGVQMTARADGHDQPALTVLLCPWLDLTLRQESLVSNASLDAVLDPRNLPFHVAAYLDGAAPTHPVASPAHADLSGLGAIYIQAAEYDVLVDDSHSFARKASESGLDVELEIAPELPHCYQFFAGVIPEADAAITRIAEKLSEHMG